jgi:hypothetical protein
MHLSHYIFGNKSKLKKGESIKNKSVTECSLQNIQRGRGGGQGNGSPYVV